MKATSGVLESSHQALSNRRIVGVIGVKVENRLGERGGLQSEMRGGLNIILPADIFTRISLTTT